MKKLVFLSIVVTLLVAAFPIVASAGTTVTAKLMAGQTEYVGHVEVWNDASNLYVRYQAKYGLDGFCLNETHLHVATDLADIPQTNSGNPIPGHFAYGDDELGCVHDIVYTIPLGDWEVGDSLIIVAHAVVGNRFDPYWEETGWGVLCGNFDTWHFPGASNWAAFIPYTVQ